MDSKLDSSNPPTQNLDRSDPKDPQADIRGAISQLIYNNYIQHREGASYDDLVEKVAELFQAREQQILTELLGELPEEKKVNPGDFSYGREMDKSYNQGRADVISIIERFLQGEQLDSTTITESRPPDQNKTNDGGRDGGL